MVAQQRQDGCTAGADGVGVAGSSMPSVVVRVTRIVSCLTKDCTASVRSVSTAMSASRAVAFVIMVMRVC